MSKTLIGKNGYLFLQNDSADELNVHQNNVYKCDPNKLEKMRPYLDKYLLIVFPNKSYLYREYLPDNYSMTFRPAFNSYHDFLSPTNRIIDGVEVLLSHKDRENVFYKTDTHLNLFGCMKIYEFFLCKIWDIFNINVDYIPIQVHKRDVDDLNSLNLGIGDLTWPQNLGDQVLENKSDSFYESNDFQSLYLRKTIFESKIKMLSYKNLEDKTEEFGESIIDWNIVSNFIFYNRVNELQNTTQDLKVLIFYDSFLISTLPLYLNLFRETFMAKSMFDESLVHKINPDIIIEFRVERFLL